jgi:hypothetical protein
MEQPELGTDSTAPDSVTLTADYRWEAGWRVRIGYRPSGATGFVERSYSGLDAAELHARVQDVLAEILGLC